MDSNVVVGWYNFLAMFFVGFSFPRILWFIGLQEDNGV